MTDQSREPDSAGPKHDRFQNTRWSLVLEMRSDHPERTRAALAELCQRYWYPLYGFIRRCGKNRQDAEDLTQGFFAQAIRLDTFSRAQKEKGKLRTFLLKALKDFLANAHEKEAALKRGGGVNPLSLDAEWAEEQIRIEPADESVNPERQFDRRWAMTLVKDAFATLGEEFHAKGKADLFEVLKPYLTGDADVPLGEAAERLGMREGATKVALHRIRSRFRETFRQTVADTLAEGEDLDMEVRATMSALTV